MYEIELLRAKVRVMEAKAEVGRESAEDASFEGGDASFDGDKDGGDVSFEGGDCAEARASSSAAVTPEVSPMSRALGLSVAGETTPTLSGDATQPATTTQPSVGDSPATPPLRDDDGSGSSFTGSRIRSSSACSRRRKTERSARTCFPAGGETVSGTRRLSL